MNIPTDIEQKIKALYPKEEDQKTAFSVYEKLLTVGLVVGHEQFFRSILILADNNIEELKRWGDNYWGEQYDDRDVVMWAEDKLGNPGEYGLKPFKF